MSQRSYYGASYDRYEAHNEESAVHKLKETYWTAKQTVIQKLGKKEDEHLIASDSALDAKLEVFRAIQKSSQDLLSVLERYQDKLCVLSNEENSMGRFLKNESQQDKTRAGKMMAAVGKAQSFASQQRLALRVPLVRLHQEVETFWSRAIADTLMTIERMEAARTDYRAALLWMKNVSEMLDPDAYKQLDKFRKVQAQVRKTKQRFDKLKLDSMQKIDLLAASRCNMYSHVLANYQSTLLNFWEKTSSTLGAVAESFRGYQYFEFHLLKDLDEPTKKLAEATSSPTKTAPEGGATEESSEGDLLSDFDEITEGDSSVIGKQSDAGANPGYAADLLDLSGHGQSESGHNRLEAGRDEFGPFEGASFSQSDVESLQPTQSALGDVTGNSGGLISLDDGAPARAGDRQLSDSLNNLLQPGDKGGKAIGAGKDTIQPFIDFGDDDGDLEEIKRKQDEELDLTGKKMLSSSDKKATKTPAGGATAPDLLSSEYDLERDDMTLLNDILNLSSVGGDDFSHQWQSSFGGGAVMAPSGGNLLSPSGESDASDFLPSHLLDLGQMKSGPISGMPGAGQPNMMSGTQPATAGGKAASAASAKPKSKKDQKADMSAWFNLFADLDPLSNPDAIGRKKDEISDA